MIMVQKHQPPLATMVVVYIFFALTTLCSSTAGTAAAQKSSFLLDHRRSSPSLLDFPSLSRKILMGREPSSCAFATTNQRWSTLSSTNRSELRSLKIAVATHQLPSSNKKGPIGLSMSAAALENNSSGNTRTLTSSSRRHRNPLRWARNAAQSIRSKFSSHNFSTTATTATRQQQQQQASFSLPLRPRGTRGILSAFLTLLIISNIPFLSWILPANAGGGMVKRNPDAPIIPLTTNELASKLIIWLSIFTLLALLHAAEIAITTLYPWKVREFAEEEEKQRGAISGGGGDGGQKKRRGTFTALNEDITRILTAILVTSTACSIYATTLFTHLADHIFGRYAEKWSAIFLTAVTLFFVELLPKNIGVINAERVARLMVPPINVLAKIVGPFGFALSYLAKATLRLFGVQAKETSGVSDSELRLIVTGARDSGTIDHSEQEMIKGVLNLQDQKVREIMKPRVEVVAVPKRMSVASVLGVVRESGYSRIPVYDGEIDNIVGIVLAKSVLDFFVKGVLVEGEYKRPPSDASAAVNGDESTAEKLQQLNPEDMGKLSFIDPPTGKTMDKYVRSLTGSQLASRMETPIDDAGLIESCYFVPDAANGWDVLQEMRKRRVHMAVVVDEYGGTEGLVSLEDIVEEVSPIDLLCLFIFDGDVWIVSPSSLGRDTYSTTSFFSQVVGEIYDEDDEDDFVFAEDSITYQEDGTFLIRGDADLEDVDAVLGLSLDEEEVLKEYGTLSGFLCFCAGEIPRVGDFIMSRGWNFEVVDADEKRIFQVRVERLLGFYDDEDDEDGDAKFGLFSRKPVQEEVMEVEDELAMMNVAAHAADEDQVTVLESTVVDSSTVSSHSDAVIRQNRILNINEGKRIERLVEQNEQKADAIRKILAEKQSAEEQDVEMSKSS
jgi:CBS domain containing-hemolysin-like protein